MKRNIPGPCGKALAVIGNPGWGDVGRDASGAGGTGAAGRAQGRGAEPAGDRAGSSAGRPRPSAASCGATRCPRAATCRSTPRAATCERRQRPAVLERDERLGRFVRERLLEGWTPEQIAGWLKRGEERGLRPSPLETIYAFVHRPGQKGEKLWKLLPRGRARRGRRRARQPRSTIAGRRSIHDRPEAVQERKEAGHWEGDLLICKRTRPVLVLKERKTRFVLAARLAGKSAAETVAVHDGGLPPARPAAAVLDHLRQRHRLRPARPARERLRHDDLVLRRVRVLAEGGGRERERPATPRPAAGPRPRRARATPSCRRSSSATT